MGATTLDKKGLESNIRDDKNNKDKKKYQEEWRFLNTDQKIFLQMKRYPSLLMAGMFEKKEKKKKKKPASTAGL